MIITTTESRVCFYINENRGRFAWVDVDQYSNENDIRRSLKSWNVPDAIDGFLCAVDAEGLARHFVTNEAFDLDAFISAAEMAEEMGDDGQAIVSAFVEYFPGYDLDECQERYQGHYETRREFAAQWAEDISLIPADAPSQLACHFDYNSYARELFSDGFAWCGGYVFANN